jgi:GNAT superfamily N-acetyltransferase
MRRDWNSARFDVLATLIEAYEEKHWSIEPPDPVDAIKYRMEQTGLGLADLARLLGSRPSGAARTFVVCEADRVVGYYALASGAVSLVAAPARFRRNMLDPIPIVVLARLAVDQSHQGRGLGRALVRDSARRVVNAADVIGIRGILVHAISEEAKVFYLRLGFDPSPIEPMTLMVTLADLRDSIG